MGDGNIHVVVILPRSVYRTSEECDSGASVVNAVVHEEAVRLNGSISAEHGIGLLKRDELPHYKDPVAIDLMRTLKSALDPHNILNPGKVVAIGSDLPVAMPHVSGR